MNWDKDSLLAKAKIFFTKAFAEDRDNIFFGLNCAMGLELLERAAIANISPTLLAEHEKESKNILYALGYEDLVSQPKSIATSNVIALCLKLINEFTDEDAKICNAIANRRNDEAHSGAMAFAEYNTDSWLAGFYKVCRTLVTSMDSDMVYLFGEDLSKEADLLISSMEEQKTKEVKDKISSWKKVFYETYNEEQISAKRKENSVNIIMATYRGGHKVECPVCGSDALISGEETDCGHPQINEDETITERKNIIATEFSCPTCGMKLKSFSELKAAGLPLHYTRTKKYSPEEYYGFPDSDYEDYIAESISDYSNE